MAVSVTLQSALVGAGVLLSIMSIERLPDFTFPAPMPPLPARPKPVQVVASEIVRTASAASTALRVFTAPSTIPKVVAMITDAPVTAEVGSPDGVVGMPTGLYTSTSSLFTRSIVPLPQPAQKAVAEHKPEAAPPKVVNIGGNVLAGKLVRRVMPVYPPLAVRARISGKVRLMGIVSRQGSVRELRAIEGHPLLVPAAIEAVRQWLYSPTYLNGEPVEVMAPIEVNFILGQ